MSPSKDQIMVLIRTVLQIGGNWLVFHGVFTVADWTTLMGAVLMVLPVVWDMLTNTKSSMVAKVNAMPEVAGVITTNTEAGLAMANSVPSSSVAPAGTIQAASVAKST